MSPTRIAYIHSTVNTILLAILTLVCTLGYTVMNDMRKENIVAVEQGITNKKDIEQQSVINSNQDNRIMNIEINYADREWVEKNFLKKK